MIVEKRLSVADARNHGDTFPMWAMPFDKNE